MRERPLAAILTLGCKLNLADSEELARGLRGAGYDVTGHLVEADAVVVNTCSVTHVADQKSRRLIRSVRRVAPAAKVAVTGCYPQTAGFEKVHELGADLVVGTRDRDKAQLLEFFTADAGPAAPPDPVAAAPALTTRAFVKAQEGCNDVCAFCIVPRTRHREESRVPDRVAEEVNAAVLGGAREVVITGTQLGAWGRDLDPPSAPHELISGVLEDTEVARLRFSSLQPQDITPELLALWDDPRLMPHFHLALQSGSDRVLRAMRRRYTAGEYRQAVERIRAAVPDAAITTDVIAGFPGETAKEFAETLRLCDELSLSRIHAFPYSERSGTVAARMGGQVDPATRKARVRELVELGGELAARHYAAYRDTVRPVLWESEVETGSGPRWHGYTDNYIAVYASGEALGNRITPARLGEAFRDGVFAAATGSEP
ncbi:MAG: MiaB/RimO family radical SAM methylthiotransferase [Dehalococcoidia bacterium]|nr:MiaB/RimO family radical SAM methylthiotransferase [Dehalococcoidia bacterium]